MPHDPRKLLFDLIAACKKIMTFTEGISYEVFSQNDLIKSAVQMQFVIIGEALMRLRSTDPALYGRITDADRIIAFRNVIAHGYDVLIDEIVWEIIQEKLPVLLNETTVLFGPSL